MSAPSAESVCPRCGTTFVCGVAAGMTTCWCMEKPIAEYAATPSLDIAKDALCLCPACLKQRQIEAAA